MFNLMHKKSPVSTKSPRRCTLDVERLEAREVMSASPVVFSAISEGNPNLGVVLDFANTPPVAGQTGNKILPTLSVSPMMETKVTGNLSNGADVDVMKVYLEKGQIFTAGVDFSTSGGRVVGAAPKLTLFNNAGQALVQGASQGIGYRIATTGAYFLGIGATVKAGAPASYSAVYTLHVRPIGLATNDLDPKWLQRTDGGIYAWKAGDMLNISGPVGHGFSIRGNWQQTTTGAAKTLASTYRTYDNLVYIQTSVGAEIPLYLDTYGMSITTKASPFGNLYGEVKSSSIWATSELVQGIVRKFGDDTPFGMDLSADNMPFTLGEIGLRLGNDPLLQATGAPLNSAVPYLFINASAGVNAVSKGTFAGVTYNLGTLIVDPGDPFLYVGSDAYSFGVGLSHHGLIPFTPEKAPSQFQGQLFGHVYVSGEFNLMEVTGLPLSVSGDIVLNLNGHGTGAVSSQSAAGLGIVSNAMTSMNDNGPATDASRDTSSGGASTASSPFWRNVSVGINGNLNFLLPIQQLADDSLTQYPGTDWFAKHPKTSMATEAMWNWMPEDLSLALASASVIYDGPNGGLYFRGGTNNWLEDTQLDFLSGTQVNIDAAWLEGGKFFLDAQGQYKTLGYTAQGRVLLARNMDLPPELAALIKGQTASGTTLVKTTGGYLELGVKVLGANVTLKGRVQSNGDFELSAATGVNIGIADSSLIVKLGRNQNQSFYFTADLTGNLSIDNLTRAKVTVHFKLGVDSNGHITYAGSGTAKVQVKTPHVSLKGVNWSWDDAASCTIGVNNNAFWFYFLGKKMELALPH